MQSSDPVNPTDRFTKTAENYDKYRPDYPAQILTLLKDYISHIPDCQIADIGSGTGIFTKQLLENNLKVSAVEPNNAMRDYAEKHLSHFDNFVSIAATAENTTIDRCSIDIITVATAFHWFNHEKVKIEFQIGRAHV